MRPTVILLRRIAILCHRWMGVAFCLLFTWWFASGIFMMYWDFPAVTAADRAARAQSLDGSKIAVSAQEAYRKLNRELPAESAQLGMLNGRPVYRFDNARAIVYADNGAVEGEYSRGQLGLIAAEWTGQPASTAQIEPVVEPDQWTVEGRLRHLRPLWKYSFPDGQQVYVAETLGRVVQYTTSWSRFTSYLGPIPHWLYYTPLRVRQKLWSNVVIWLSGVATIAALLGLAVGISLVSPQSKYRIEGSRSRIPYTGQKRLHMILGVFFGTIACTWAFSGMLSMDPFPTQGNPQRGDSAPGVGVRVEEALHAGQFRLADFDARPVPSALSRLSKAKVKTLDFTYFDNKPVFLATLDNRETRILPLDAPPQTEFDSNRIVELMAQAVKPFAISENWILTRYDAYYRDRHGELPLPVLFVRLNDSEKTQLYIDPRTGTIVGQHSGGDSWISRWLYHGLHSLDFPWLYNHRPAWDIVVLGLLLGGLTLSVTSVILGWQLLRRKLA